MISLAKLAETVRNLLTVETATQAIEREAREVSDMAARYCMLTTPAPEPVYTCAASDDWLVDLAAHAGEQSAAIVCDAMAARPIKLAAYRRMDSAKRKARTPN